MNLSEFSGTPYQIGKSCGKHFSNLISTNIDILVKRIGCIPRAPLPCSYEFSKWISDQERIVFENWPWLIDEIHGIAEGSRQKYRDILFLNLRVWQYDLYSSGSSETACSSMLVTLADGSVANTGALDDNREYYCGIVKVVPDDGYSYITFPIAGTCWGNRGINSAGLCIGASSQILKDLIRDSGSICADIANRVILQTCATVNDVREFCAKHPFTLNLVCSDRNGDVFCTHQTTGGMFELSNSSPCAMTNHISDDMIMYKIKNRGVEEFKESFTTRLRRGRLMDFIYQQNSKCSAKEVRSFIADRMNGDLSSICPKGNIVMMYANSQLEPGIIWIAEPQVANNENWEKYSLD